MTKPESSTLTKAKSLRTHQTEAEARLWYHLRAHRFMGLKFKRQKPVGRYIVDFICWERRLIVELDGGQHAGQSSYDRQRDAWLRSQGYTVLRFWNHEVMQEMEAVLERMRCVIESSSQGEKGRITPGGTGYQASPLPLAGEG
ncbi:endonuclease domain-containing protein [Thiobacillus sedimenti]|uniref:Endonuclease domain-containing protein n=1 Tax=Thiobacillus sedimenti TaxID=3110231 RepID=A0ABZ1CN21_9PROT|nr:endonuclease domain-containing protein [Thiobacillus sp. SCUT-2]WRS40671.1 endonuclease domain-containing protein [Thiobacillus sp. SCUT-2]